MKMFKVILVLIAILSITACGNETETETETGSSNGNQESKMIDPSTKSTQQSITIEYHTIAKEENGTDLDLDIVVPQINGIKSIENQDEINNYFLNLGTDFESSVRNYLDSIIFESSLADSEYSAGIVKGYMNFEVTLVNDKVISLSIHKLRSPGFDSAKFEENIYFNYDLSSDKRIELQTFFEEGRNYLTELNNLVKEKMTEEELSNWYDDGSIASRMRGYYLTKDDLVLVFSSTSNDSRTFEIPINKQRIHALKEEYK